MRLLLIFSATLLLSQLCPAQAIITKHGFRFINHTNSGGQRPQPGDWVLVQTYAHIKDSLMLDTRRDFGGPQESELHPEEDIQGPINSMYDAIFLMGVGDSVTVYEPLKPEDMQYVPEGLQDATEVAYTMVLVNITSKEEKEKLLAEEAAAEEQAQQKAQEKIAAIDKKMQAVLKDYKAGKLKKKLKTTPSGVKILIAEKGTGDKVGPDVDVSLDYYGCLISGEMFDNSYQRGQLLSFTTAAQQMIPGFDEGIQELNHGGKAYLFIPAELAYGNEEVGPIPANSELIFYVEVL